MAGLRLNKSSFFVCKKKINGSSELTNGLPIKYEDSRNEGSGNGGNCKPWKHRTPILRRSLDQVEVGRRSKERTSRAPRRTSSLQRAAPTNPSPPVTTKVLPSIPSFSLRCITPGFACPLIFQGGSGGL